MRALVIYLSPDTSRRADDIFSAQRSITRSICSPEIKNAMCITQFEIMTLLKSEQILFTSESSPPRTTSDKNYNNIFINSQNSKEISDDLASILKHFVRNFVIVK